MSVGWAQGTSRGGVWQEVGKGARSLCLRLGEPVWGPSGRRKSFSADLAESLLEYIRASNLELREGGKYWYNRAKRNGKDII